MDKIIVVRGWQIPVKFVKHALRITNNNQLSGLLAHDTEAATDELVTALKQQYESLFDTSLLVSDTSLAVEIWGHVYVDKFFDIVKKVSTFTVIDKVADKIKHYCDIIDVGEKKHDENRFVWDGLSPFKSMIAKLLPHT